MQYPDFKVCVRCFTYNQSKYITDALNGFCIQDTNFPFVCCVVDDASTDGEQDVIRKYILENFNFDASECSKQYETDYAEVLYAQHKTNKNCYFAVLFLKENLYSKNQSLKKWQYISEWRDCCKYEAICEGDDYWTDKDKLQKQINIFMKDSDVSMVHCCYRVVDKDGQDLQSPSFDYMKLRGKFGNVFSELLRDNYPQTLTTCIDLRKFPVKIFEDAPCKFDYTIFLAAASVGKIAYITDIVGCYRRLSTGMIGSASCIISKYIDDVFEYFADLFLSGKIPYTKDINKSKCKREILIKSIRIDHNNGNHRLILKYFKQYPSLSLYIIPSLLIRVKRIFEWRNFCKTHKWDNSWRIK